MPDAAVEVTEGVGTPVTTFQNALGQYEQYVRIRPATSIDFDEWPITTTGVASRISADITRVGVLIVNNGSGRVYIRFDNTIPTANAYMWFVDPGERYEVQPAFVQRAISFAGVSSGGELYTTLGTAA